MWSNKQNAWWGPNGHSYRHDVWAAGRYDLAGANDACGRRTWEKGKPPPEVAVLAPEADQPTFTPDEIRDMDAVMAKRVRKATRAAMRARTEEAAAL